MYLLGHTKLINQHKLGTKLSVPELFFLTTNKSNLHFSIHTQHTHPHPHPHIHPIHPQPPTPHVPIHPHTDPQSNSSAWKSYMQILYLHVFVENF